MKTPRPLVAVSLALLGSVAYACGGAVVSDPGSAPTTGVDASFGTGFGTATGVGSGPSGPFGTGPGSGSGTFGSGSVGTSFGSGSVGSSGGSGTGAPSAGCAPNPLPAGFVATPRATAPAGCTAAEDVAVAGCALATPSDGGVCVAVAPDGGLDTCGQCVYTAVGASTWGAFLEVRPPTAVGATTTTPIDMYNVGGCVGLVDPSPTGKACATALDELTQCELAACLPTCPVSSPQDTSGRRALFGDGFFLGCIDHADEVVCLSLANAVNTVCTAETNDAGTGAIDRCNALLTVANAATASAPAGLEQYLGLFCGGADAGL